MDIRRPTVQLLGRWQPWHDGHTELFKRAIAKTGQVAIMVRDTGEKFHDRIKMIQTLKQEGYRLDVDYMIIDVPNITNITYGRKVGYTIEQEKFDSVIENISGTDIRAKC
tara:strand:- start:417 stop:746 length:330 start_codon:yes stop_codon:yes gene_type:complete